MEPTPSRRDDERSGGAAPPLSSSVLSTGSAVTNNPDFMSSWLGGDFNASAVITGLNDSFLSVGGASLSVGGSSLTSSLASNRRSLLSDGRRSASSRELGSNGGAGPRGASDGVLHSNRPSALSISTPGVPGNDGGDAVGGGLAPPSALTPHGRSMSLANVESALHDAARVTNWTEAHRLAVTKPHYARFTGPDGWTALHHSLSRRGCPPQVVEALIKAYPGALVDQNENKFTPLHFACRFKAPPEIVRLLLLSSPAKGRAAASMRCNKGRTPLYYAVRYDAPDGVDDMLLAANPHAVLDEDRDGVSPLALVWDKYATRLEGKQALHRYLQGRTESGGSIKGGDGDGGGAADAAPGPPPPLRGKLKDRWERSNRLLRAAFRFPPEREDRGGSADGRAPERKWRVLHATAAIKCHVSLFELASVLHPEQASELDENDLYGPDLTGDGTVAGRASAPSAAAAAVAAGAASPSSPAPPSRRTALHFAALSPSRGRAGRTVIASLLALDPTAAARPDGVDGSLPLHLLAENERKAHWIHDGAAELHAAHPGAVGEADGRGRLPLHRACAAAAHRVATGLVPAGMEVAAAPAAPQAPGAGPDPQAQPAAAPQDANVNANAAPLLHPELDSAGSVGSIVQNLLSLLPSAASSPDSDGALPLHVLATNGEGWDADAEAVLSAHPAAARARAGPALHRRLPIHLAAASPDAGRALVRRLVDANPRGVSQSDGRGKLPLHLACETGKAWESGTGDIYEAYTRAVREAESNPRGWTALHMAASGPGGEAADLVGRLVDLYPQAAAVRDGGGRYPLHWACEAGKPWEGGTEAIFRSCPDAAIAEDNRGWLPLHAAAMSYGATSPGAPLRSDEDDDAANRRRSLVLEDLTSSIPDVSRENSIDSAEGQPSPGRRSHSRAEETVEELARINIVYHLVQEAPIVLKV